MSGGNIHQENLRFPSNYPRWLWARVQVYLFVCFVLANLFFVWAALKAARYSVIGGIVGFWLIALSPWYLPLLDRLSAAPTPGSSSSRAKGGHIPLVVVVVAGALFLWALSSTGSRVAVPG